MWEATVISNTGVASTWQFRKPSESSTIVTSLKIRAKKLDNRSEGPTKRKGNADHRMDHCPSTVHAQGMQPQGLRRIVAVKLQGTRGTRGNRGLESTAPMNRRRQPHSLGRDPGSECRPPGSRVTGSCQWDRREKIQDLFGKTRDRHVDKTTHINKLGGRNA